VHSIVITSVLCVLISLYAAAFTVLTSISTITLYLAYGIPIFLNLRNRARRQGEFTTRETAAWNLGRSGPAIALVALLWVAVIAVIFSLPPNELVLWTMLGLGGVLLAYWFGNARARFRGPVKR
jgi:L-asparagine transporter-like permease